MSFPLNALAGYPISIREVSEVAATVAIDVRSRGVATLVRDLQDRCPGIHMLPSGKDCFLIDSPEFEGSLEAEGGSAVPAVLRVRARTHLSPPGEPREPGPRPSPLAMHLGNFVRGRTGSTLAGLGAAFAVTFAEGYLAAMARSKTGTEGFTRQGRRRS